MASYLARRLLFAAFLVFAVSSASLVLVHFAPGDYAVGALGLRTSPEAMAQLRTVVPWTEGHTLAIEDSP